MYKKTKRLFPLVIDVVTVCSTLHVHNIDSSSDAPTSAEVIIKTQISQPGEVLFFLFFSLSLQLSVRFRQSDHLLCLFCFVLSSLLQKWKSLKKHQHTQIPPNASKRERGEKKKNAIKRKRYNKEKKKKRERKKKNDKARESKDERCHPASNGVVGKTKDRKSGG